MTSSHTHSDGFKRAYEMQKKAREIAERRLEDKSRELYTKNQSLEKALIQLGQQQEKLIAQEKLASIGQLAAGLAHELNNPNAFIQNNLVTLGEYIEQLVAGLECAFDNLTELTKQSPELKAQASSKIDSLEKATDIKFIKSDLSSILKESLNGTKRIEVIANSLRYFASPDLTSSKPVDINECLNQAKQLISTQDLAKVQLEYQLSDLPKMNGIPLLLSQAFSNIILNAIEASPKSKKVLIQSCSANDKIIIAIQDDGKGISEKNLATIFHPFVSLTHQQSGLGLSIAQNIISQHQGEIQIKSTEGKGTTVTIELPLGKV